MNLRTQLDFFHDPAPDVPALVASGALFVLNHSGGADSQAAFIKVARMVPPELMLCVHAPLGRMEWIGAKELAQKQAAHYGVPFVLARHHRGITLLDKVAEKHEHNQNRPILLDEHGEPITPKRRSPWPSDKQRWCTSDFKSGPCQREVRRYATQHGFTTIVNCLGLRASESTERFKALPWVLNDKQTNSRRTWWDWLPIHNFFKSEAFALIAQSGERPHLSYLLGNDRLSCLFCIYGSANDLRNAAIAAPELYEEYVALEEYTGYTMHMSRKPLVEIVGLTVKQAYQMKALNQPQENYQLVVLNQPEY